MASAQIQFFRNLHKIIALEDQVNNGFILLGFELNIRKFRWRFGWDILDHGALFAVFDYKITNEHLDFATDPAILYLGLVFLIHYVISATRNCVRCFGGTEIGT